MLVVQCSYITTRRSRYPLDTLFLYYCAEITYDYSAQIFVAVQWFINHYDHIPNDL